jgi:hypothetical protein
LRLGQELGLGADTILMGLIARFHPMKDHETFLREVALLTARYPNVHYVFAGHRIESGNAAIQAMLKASGVDGEAHLLGERSDTPAISAALDIASLASCIEAFPNVIAEAMASEIPCVVTDARDTTSLVGDTTATQPVRNAEALAAGWADLMERGARGPPRNWKPMPAANSDGALAEPGGQRVCEPLQRVVNRENRMRSLFRFIAATGLAGLAMASLAGAASTSGNVLTIVSDGSTRYEILTDSRGADGVREAAWELQRLIKKATGVRLPIVHAPTATNHQIVVGTHDLATKSGITDTSLADDSYRIKVTKGNIYLIGKDDARKPFYMLNSDQSASAGSYFAVIDFARRFLQARWYMPSLLGEEIGRFTTISIPADLEITGQPHFRIRYLDIASTKTRAYDEQLFTQGSIKRRYFDPEIADAATRWGRHLRLGSNFPLITEHSWYQWLPADRPSQWSATIYGSSHPEYFAIPGGKNGHYYQGNDNAHGGQLCIYRPDVARALANNIVAFARRSGERAFSLSPNDGDWECARDCCGESLAGNTKSGEAMTTPVLRFTNDVAAMVLKEVPDARFGLYAYHWTLEPPADVRANDRIDISDVYNGMPYAYQVPAQRANMERLIRRWRQVSASVTLTTYYTFEGNYSLPWSTLNVQEWMIKLLSEYPSSAGVRMNYADLDFPPMGMLGPDPWVLSELLWDPTQSVQQLQNEFYKGAFGPKAAILIQEYFAIIAASMQKTISAMPYTELNGVPAYITPAYATIRSKCRALIDRAVAAVSSDDERYRWRVDRIARGWQFTEITLDALAASRLGSTERAKTLWAERRRLLTDPDSVLSLAPAANDSMELGSPLIPGRMDPPE